MVDGRLTRRRAPAGLGLPPPAERYLTALDEALPGSSRSRSMILYEVGDGLAESVDRHRSAGQDPETAAESAVAEFGDVRDLAGELAREMAGTIAHRVGIALIATGPLVGLGWLTAFALSSGLRLDEQVGPILAWIPGYGLLIAAVVATAMTAAAAGAGPASRYLVISPRKAAAAAALAAAGCLAVDAALLAHLARLTMSGTFSAWLAVPASLSLLRVAFAAIAGHRCFTARAAAAADG